MRGYFDLAFFSMRTSAKMLMLLSGTLLLGASLARADEDGAFCISKGYLTYQLRGGITPGVDGHVVRVVRFEPKRGIYAAGEVAIEGFQVHGMTCDQDRVSMYGWGMVFQRYVIEIRDPQNVHVVEHSEDAARKFDPAKDGPEPHWLWDEKQPGTLPLESLDPDHKYQLVFTRSQKSVEGGIEHSRKAELVQFDSQGNTSQRVVLYNNHFLETID